MNVDPSGEIFGHKTGRGNRQAERDTGRSVATRQLALHKVEQSPSPGYRVKPIIEVLR